MECEAVMQISEKLRDIAVIFFMHNIVLSLCFGALLGGLARAKR